MEIISKDIARKFCETCNWAYEVWITHKKLFDENIDHERNIGKVKHFAHRLSIITQEYGLLQITKLHDPAVQRKSTNLTIEYIIRFGEWEEDEHHMKLLQQRLSDLYEKIRQARNKILAHNDIEAALGNEIMGSFPE